MTIIVGYHCFETGDVWIGADTRATHSDGFILPSKIDKLVASGPWVIGCAGNALTIQIIRLHAESLGKAETPETLALSIMTLIESAGFKRDEESEAPGFGQSFVLARHDGVWGMAHDGFVARPEDGFIACGCGQDFAYGAFSALSSLLETGYKDCNAYRVVSEAIEASCRYDSTCDGATIRQVVLPEQAASTVSEVGEPAEGPGRQWLHPEDAQVLSRRGL